MRLIELKASHGFVRVPWIVAMCPFDAAWVFGSSMGAAAID